MKDMKWNDIKECSPSCYISGDWDGLKSDLLLVCNFEGDYRVCSCYGNYDGGYDSEDLYFEFYDNVSGLEVLDVTHWLEIDLI